MTRMKITIKKPPGRRTGLGTGWVEGTVGPYRFQALVFPEHADNEDWELGRSKISKLWIGYSGQTVFNWDRGLDHPAELIQEHQAVNTLKDNLARMVFGASAGGKRRKAATLHRKFGAFPAGYLVTRPRDPYTNILLWELQAPNGESLGEYVTRHEALAAARADARTYHKAACRGGKRPRKGKPRRTATRGRTSRLATKVQRLRKAMRGA